MSQNPNDTPERIDYGQAQAQPKAQAGGMGALVRVLVPAVLAVVVVWLLLGMGIFGTVSKSDFTSNLTSIAKDIAGLKTLTGSMQASVDGATKSVADMQASVTKASSDITALKSSASTYITQDKLTAVSNSVSTLQQGVTSIQNDLNKVKTDIGNLNNIDQSTTIKNLQKSIADLQAGLTADQNTVKILQTAIGDLNTTIKALQTTVATLQTPTPTPTPTTTPTPTPTTTPTSGSVTATIAGNAFTGSTYMSLTPITTTTTGSAGGFTIQVTNNTGKTITGLQLAVALGVYDNTNPANPVPLAPPTGITYALSSGGNLNLIWTAQTTGLNYVIGFLNQVNTGQFAFGNLSQAPGSANYSQTFTFTGNGTAVLPATLVIPTVKVITFTTQ